MKWKLGFIAVVVVLLSIPFFQNLHPVKLQLYTWNLDTNLVWVILGSFLLGIIVTVIGKWLKNYWDFH